MEFYVEAVGRKLEIAEFHHVEVCRMMPTARSDQRNLPPIPLQAHFEAGGRAIVAMLDQIAAGIAEVAHGMPSVYRATPQRVIECLEPLSTAEAVELSSLLRGLNDDPRVNDLRDVRNRAIHRFDGKANVSGIGWCVDPPGFCRDGIEPFDGSRLLTEYLRVMLEFGQEVVETVPRICDLASGLEGRS